MNPIRQYQSPPQDNQPVAFERGFSLAVVIILAFAAIIIGGLVASFHQSLDAANARLVYLAAQANLLDYIGAEVNQDAIITVVDENRDAAIDYIVYRHSGRVSSYAPGNLQVTKEN